MSSIHLYQEIMHANFAPGRSIVAASYSFISTTSPRKYRGMTARRQRLERGFFWFKVVFFGITTLLLCMGIGYDPEQFWNGLLNDSIWAMLAAPALILYVFYQFAITQGYLRWMYKHKKTEP